LSEETYENGGLLRYRVNRNSDRIDKIENRLSDIEIARATMKVQLQGLREDLGDLHADLRSFKRIFVTASVSLIVALLTFSFSILAATKRI